MRSAALAAAILTSGCGFGRMTPRDAGVLSRPDAAERARALEAIGRQMFVDPSLSASGRLSCASCHSPDHAFGPPDGEPVRRGGVAMDQEGTRAVPSLRYLQIVPRFTEHFFASEEEGDESVDAGPTGGLTWDGRVDRGRDQVRIPLLSPLEMANRGPADVVARVAKAPYARGLAALFGGSLFTRESVAFSAITQALEAYQQTAEEFYPYNSKYDAFLAGKAELTAGERRGLALFEDPVKGNCARCHFSRPGRNGTPPQFTDYSLVAIGVPRNRALAVNKDASYFDLGMCGPLRVDLRDRKEYCGRFMTPTLRNVATRRVFFHNGVFHTLREVVEFYAERDTRPDKFDDLPLEYRANVDQEAPFGRRPGDPPALTSAEIDAIVAFLGTLTDGYR